MLHTSAGDCCGRCGAWPLVPRSLNWVEVPVITEEKVLHRLLSALKGETVASATPLWKLVNPYHGLEAMNETNADYFCGRTRETTALLSALAS